MPGSAEQKHIQHKFVMLRPKYLLNVLSYIIGFVMVADKMDSAEGQPKKIGLMDLNVSGILDELQEGYDKRIRPNYGGPCVEVGVTMYVLSISSLSEVQMDFTLDFYFRQYWKDPRLAFDGILKRKQEQNPDLLFPPLDILTVGAEYIKKIWVPDTFFVNEKESYWHTATTSNEFLRINKDGNVFRSIRLTITASCPMDLQYFPMDRQLCTIEIESFGYTLADIKYSWKDGPSSVGVSKDVSLPQFKVLGYRQRAKEIYLTSGNYSRLACQIQFVRSMGYYLIQIYIPSGLIVVISWVSFWLNRNATPARVALGITTVLTMTTLMSSTNAALPKISYAKSIDVYLGACFVMVFASLLEYATVGYMGKRIQMRKTRILAMQKLAEKKNPPPVTWEAPGHSHGPPVMDPEWTPKQTEVRYKINDPKMHTKGGTLENTVNGGRSRSHSHIHSHTHSHAHAHGHPHASMVGHGPMGSHGALVGPHPHHGAMQGHAMDHYSRGRSRADDFPDEDIEAPPPGPPGPPPMSGPPPVPGPGPVVQATAAAMIPHHNKDLNKLYGLTPSDIDKYSRIVFPVCFVCFNLMYWIIYLHISDVVADDLVFLNPE